MTKPIASPAEYDAAIAQLTDAAATYYAPADDTAVSPLTDLEYDQLVEAVREYEAAHPEAQSASAIIGEVAAGVASGDVPHPTPMLSLDKATENVAIEKFLARLTDAGEQTVLIQPKLDGLAIRAVYRDAKLVQVVTRGDGRAGEDITDRILRDQVTVAGLPQYIGTSAPVAFEVRGELVMSREDFLASNANRIAAGKPGFANPRNATAGSARVETLTYDVQMTFVTYDHDGFPSDPDAAVGFIFAEALPGAARSSFRDGGQHVLDVVRDFGEMRAEYDYPTDGIVIKAATPAVRDELGATSRAPKWAIAYKYEAQTGESVIRDIVVEVGRTGNLSFTAVFDPVLVDGSTVSRASLHNVEQIARLDIRIGSKAVVYKANDIIPQVLSVENDADTVPWTPPTEDEDGFPYDQGQVIWRSTNPSASISGLIKYAASRDVLDIDGLGREVADALVTENVVFDISDLFTLDAPELAELDMGFTSTGNVRRLGLATAKKIVANIENARTQPLNRIITALGIRLTGRTFGRRLAAHFKSLDALLAASVEDLMQVEGVGEGRAQVIHAGLRKNEQVIKNLIALGVTSEVDEDGDAPKPLLGADGKPMSVVVTGAMTGKLATYGRTQMNELIDQYGGKASGSVSKNTGLLVCGEVGSSKWQKATDLGVRIVTPEEFAAELGL
jgi:DNA ligase (NAD+)